MDRKLLKEKIFINIAKEISKLSTCARIKVGAILVKDDRIISMGYNGVPKNKIHCEDIFKNNINDEEHRLFSYYNELHAEQNTIIYAAKNGININNSDIYITITPCFQCAKLLISAGIKNLYYLEKYDREDTIKFLEENGINVKKIEV